MCLVTLFLQFMIISSNRLIPVTLLAAKSCSCLIRFSSMKNTILIWNRNYVFSEASLSCPSEKSVHISDDTSPLDNEMLLSRAATKWYTWSDFFFSNFCFQKQTINLQKQHCYFSVVQQFLLRLAETAEFYSISQRLNSCAEKSTT